MTKPLNRTLETSTIETAMICHHRLFLSLSLRPSVFLTRSSEEIPKTPRFNKRKRHNGHLSLYSMNTSHHIPYQTALLGLASPMPSSSLPRPSMGGKSPPVAGSDDDVRMVPKSRSSFIALGVVGSKNRGGGVAGEPLGVVSVCTDEPSMVGHESLDSVRPQVFSAAGAMWPLMPPPRG